MSHESFSSATPMNVASGQASVPLFEVPTRPQALADATPQVLES